MPDADKRRRRRRRPPTDDPIAALADRVLESPQAGRVLSAFERLIDRAGNAIDPTRQPRMPPPEAPPQQPPPPPPRRRPNKSAIARSIMHFATDEPLTKAKITKRRRQLAEFCHPDKGGSPGAMTKLNQAADVLLAELK